MKSALNPQPTMAGNAPKKLGPQWEAIFKKYGYEWDENTKQYVSTKFGTRIEVYPDNSVQAYFASGEMKQYPNLGTILRTIAHAHRRRHPIEKPAEPAPAGEPKAQVTESDYKDLYRFLYT